MKPRKSRKGIGGPKPKPIDLDMLAKLGTIHCTMAECAAMLGCAADRFIRDKVANRVYYEAREKGKMSLRRRQYQLAMEGDKTMLVWLGKNMLAQTDRAAVEHSGPDRGPIETQTDHTATRETLDDIARRIARRIAAEAGGPDCPAPSNNGSAEGFTRSALRPPESNGSAI